MTHFVLFETRDGKTEKNLKPPEHKALGILRWRERWRMALSRLTDYRLRSVVRQRASPARR